MIHNSRRWSDVVCIPTQSVGTRKAHTSICNSEIDNGLIALAESGISQLNGYAFCCGFRTNELGDMGITQDVIDKIPGHKHSVSFNTSQALILRWAGALHHLSEDMDDILSELQAEFNQKEIIELTSSIFLMETLTRMRISSGEKLICDQSKFKSVFQ